MANKAKTTKVPLLIVFDNDGKNNLEKNGYHVLKIFDKDELEIISDKFLKTAMGSSELNQNINITQFVLGGVGYVPFPSFWYNPFIQTLYQIVFKKIIENKIFDLLLNENKNMKISMSPDRPLIRFPTQIVDETGKWHQDDAANATEEDRIFGGWVNLNKDVTQYFKCIPGTHKHTHTIFNSLEQKNGARRGFASFKNKQDTQFLESYWRDNIEQQLVEIPPGHILIFEENMIHTVFKNPKTDKHILRIHTSFVISQNNIALNDRNKVIENEKLEGLFENQELVPVRSGQKTPLFSPFHYTPKLKYLVENLSIIYKDHLKDDNGCIKRYLISLREQNELDNSINMQPKMTKDDKSIYYPSRGPWNLRNNINTEINERAPIELNI